MLAALQFPTVFSPPVGIWWFDPADEVMRSYYLPGNEPFEVLGRASMGGVQSAPQWEYWAQRMADRTPQTIAWETIDVSDQSSPQEVLALMVKRDKVAA